MQVSITLVVGATVAFFIGRYMFWQSTFGKGCSRTYYKWKERAALNGLKYSLWWVIVWAAFNYGFFPFLWDHLTLAK